MDISFRLNGELVSLTDVDPTRSVLDFLREDKGLTGTKEGCNEGDCGACSALVGDAGGVRAQNTCLMMLGHLDGRALVTVEGLAAPDGTPHPVQQALVDHHGSQCGFCTPGFAVTLAAGHLSSDHDIKTLLGGNLCRCTGYAPILRAAEAAATETSPPHLKDALEAPRPDASKEAGPACPGAVDALATLYADHPEATLIGGATEVALDVNKALKDLPFPIFLGQVREFDKIEITEDKITFGAGASIETLRRIMAGHHPGFAEMLTRFGSAQVRAAGTIGGNVANGSPIAETPPPLIALGAELHLRHRDARRNLPLEQYYVAYGQQDRRDGEFIEAVSIPRQKDRLRSYKIARRFDQDICTVLGAFNIHVNVGKVLSARIAFGGMAGVVKRAEAVERALIGRPWTRETVAAALDAFETDFAPISDLRAGADYRREVARNLLLRYWHEDQGTPVAVMGVTP
ncbi:xanthine dehydrogenase small subunit [Aliiroseovarius sp.]|uniref:xanthine dehydrogenase small subunit n=1 Tax=Aliiroseovarius sp. TaxID=1872442 RepID=UPI0026029500|nr:xanthine dehydrogenase small subunit [Aliiroseovarius sp.]